MKISNTAIDAIKKNNRAIGRLMIAFDRGQRSMEKWFNRQDVRLTTPQAVSIIKEETGLTEDEILEPVTANIITE